MSNPNGAWAYRYSTALGGAFTAATATSTYGAGNEVVAWNPTGTPWPTIGLNTAGVAVSFGAGNVITLDPGQGILHPGEFCAFAVVRYVVPGARTAAVAATFEGVDAVGTTTDVHVLLNGASVFDGLVDGHGATIALAAGDVIEFAVGAGSNGTCVDDSTGLRASITDADVPEPGNAALLAGMFGMLALRRRQG